jgi:predicted MFS family arabinose efflux permease
MSAAAVRGPVRVASAGIGVVGVSYGMARYGVGLLAPDIRATFGLGSGALGVLAAASYVAYLATTVTAGAVSHRVGPRVVVGAGGACAVVGMCGAALAPSPAALFAALLVAGASAGLVFPPFSDVVATRLEASRRPRVLAAISSGTGWGVAVAAPVAAVTAGNWRVAWLVFAALAAAATAWALASLPAGTPSPPAEPVRLRPSWFVCPRSGPLLAGAGLIGLASSVYWTFAVDHVSAAGGLSTGQSRLFLAVVGVASVGGSVGGDAVRRLGARPTFTLAVSAEALSLVLLGLAPSALGAVMASALLFGAAYNVAVTVEVIWSAAIFAARPAAGLAAVLVMNAAGLLAGPPLAGAAADHAGFASVFCAAGAVALATVAVSPRGRLDR